MNNSAWSSNTYPSTISVVKASPEVPSNTPDPVEGVLNQNAAYYEILKKSAKKRKFFSYKVIIKK